MGRSEFLAIFKEGPIYPGTQRWGEEEAGKGQRHSTGPAPELSFLSFVMKG